MRKHDIIFQLAVDKLQDMPRNQDVYVCPTVLVEYKGKEYHVPTYTIMRHIIKAKPTGQLNYWRID